MSKQGWQNCWCTIAAVVLLRLCIGLHFFHEGTEKLTYDRPSGRFEVTFSAEPFLRQATGPLAGWYHRQVPEQHDWQQLLAAPRNNEPPTDEEQAAAEAWQADYNERRAEAQRNEQSPPVEYSPYTSYGEWANRIVGDWQEDLQQFTAIADLTEAQQTAAAEAFVLRREALGQYLAAEAEPIAEYRHELWRLAEWQSQPEAGSVPFVDERIATKTAETRSTPSDWVAGVRGLEDEYHQSLQALLTDAQRADPAVSEAVHAALADPKAVRLEQINRGVAWLVVGIGVLLLVGFITRLASLAGVLFLLSIMASQPPWVSGAVSDFFYYQLVEVSALLVLMTSGAGRWAGLDFFPAALWRWCFGSRD